MKQLFVLFLAFCASTFTVFAQTEVKNLKDMEATAKKEGNLGWSRGGDLGLNLNGFGINKPRLTDGTSQLGFGGLVNLKANNKSEKSFWNNAATIQLGGVRAGKDNPVTKSADLVRVLSRYGYRISGDKIFAAIQGDLETQVTKTYTGLRFRSDNANELQSKFLAPMRLNLAPGVIYKPNTHLALFVSPIALNFIYVGDDNLAALKGQPLGNEEGKNNRVQLGYKLNAEYNNVYFNERLALNSNFTWFADYRQNLNGYALWSNTATIQIFKGLGLKLLGEYFYDHFSKAVVKEIPTGTKPADYGPYLGLAPTLRGGFFLTYSRIF